MANAVSPWRALRPVLLAGAATLTWLTFSSPGASADVLSDTTSLLGGVTSSVSSVTDRVAGPAPTTPAPSSPAAAPHAGLLQPVVGQVSGLADNIVSVVPVVNQVVPSGTVTSVAAPIAQLTDGTTAAVVEVVVPPVTETLPVLEPVLEPVSELVAGTEPLPVELPELPTLTVDEDVPPAAAAVVPRKLPLPWNRPRPRPWYLLNHPLLTHRIPPLPLRVPLRSRELLRLIRRLLAHPAPAMNSRARRTLRPPLPRHLLPQAPVQAAELRLPAPLVRLHS
jgi:hypothetical protein